MLISITSSGESLVLERVIQKLPIKLTVAVVVACLVLVSLKPIIARADPIGQGTYQDPYQISDCSGLAAIPSNVAGGTYYELTASFSCEGPGFAPIMNFGGTFSGNGYTISDLSIYDPSSTDVGLFGSTTDQAYITGINLTNETVVGLNNVGGLIGYSEGSTIQYCNVNAGVAGDNDVGGLIGQAVSGSYMASVSTSGTVTGLSGGSFGGIVGYEYGGNISYAYSTTSLVDSSSTTGNYGGLVGDSYRGSYSQDYTSGDLTSPSSNTTNQDNVGGLFGEIYETTASLVFSVASMSDQDNDNGGNTGGFAGYDSGANSSHRSDITDVFYDLTTTKQSGRCVGSISNLGGVINGYCNAVDGSGSQPDYFFSSTNPPVSNFDFSSQFWQSQTNGLPILNSFPGAPTALTMVAGSSTSLTFSWTAPGNDNGQLPAEDYLVSYWPTANPNALESVDINSTDTQAKVFDLNANQSYSFEVQATYVQYSNYWGQFSSPLVVNLSNDLHAGPPSAYTWTNLTANTSYSSLGLDDLTTSGSGQYLAAISDDGYIYTSSDYGQTWTNNNDSSGDRGWFKLSGSSSGQYLAAVVINGDVYVSQNYGQTWTDTASGAMVGTVLNVNVSADGQYMIVASEGDGAGVYVSSDYGQTWNTTDLVSTTSLTTWVSVAASATGQYMIAADYNNDIYESSDYGQTWTDVSSSVGTQGWLWMATSSNGQYITAAVEGGDIYVSANYGQTWADATSAIGAAWQYVEMSSSGQYQVASSVGLGIYVSNDYGATWSLNSGAGIGDWDSVAMSANGEYIYAANTGNENVYLGTVASPLLSNITTGLSVDSSVTVNVLNGVSGADSSTLSIVTPPIHGSAYDPPGTITYTPDSGYSGSDSLVYQVCSSFNNTVCSTATLSFNVIKDGNVGAPNTGYGEPTTSAVDLTAYSLTSVTLFGLGIALRRYVGHK